MFFKRAGRLRIETHKLIVIVLTVEIGKCYSNNFLSVDFFFLFFFFSVSFLFFIRSRAASSTEQNLQFSTASASFYDVLRQEHACYTSSIAFRHLPSNSARRCYTTVIHLVSPKVWILLIRLWKQHSVKART